MVRPRKAGRTSTDGLPSCQDNLHGAECALDLSAGLGVHAVEVDAIDDSAAAFYSTYGFTSLLDDPLHLYLPISTVEDLLA